MYNALPNKILGPAFNWPGISSFREGKIKWFGGEKWRGWGKNPVP